MLSTQYIRENKVIVAILLFIVFFATIHSLKPRMIYNEQDGFRQFGIGYKQKTVVPIWVVSIILAVFCYLAVYYLR